MKMNLNGFQLKVVGLITMVIDHIGEFFSFLGAPIWFHWIGRIAAPIFLFESSEGFIHTRNRKKYMLRLLVGFWIMQIVTYILNTYFAVGNTLIINNIFGTLFLGTVYMQSIEYLKKSNRSIAKALLWFLLPTTLSFVPLILLGSATTSPLTLTISRLFNFLVPTLFLTEGGILFVLLPVLFYLFHNKKLLQIISLTVIAALSTGFSTQGLFSTNYQWMMILAVVPIIMYNGEKGKSMRYFFYIFYPAHIALFAILSFFMQK